MNRLHAQGLGHGTGCVEHSQGRVRAREAALAAVWGVRESLRDGSSAGQRRVAGDPPRPVAYLDERRAYFNAAMPRPASCQNCLSCASLQSLFASSVGRRSSATSGALYAAAAGVGRPNRYVARPACIVGVATYGIDEARLISVSLSPEHGPEVGSSMRDTMRRLAPQRLGVRRRPLVADQQCVATNRQIGSLQGTDIPPSGRLGETSDRVTLLGAFPSRSKCKWFGAKLQR